MCLFENESFLSIIKHYKTISFNILVPIVDDLASHHWHQMLKESLTALKDILQKIDSQAYNAALESASQKKTDKTLRINMPKDERDKLDQKWKNFEKIAKKTNPNFVEPVLPFSDNYVIGNYNSVYKNIYNKEKYLG